MKLHKRKMKHLSLLLAVPLILAACSDEDDDARSAVVTALDTKADIESAKESFDKEVEQISKELEDMETDNNTADAATDENTNEVDENKEDIVDEDEEDIYEQTWRYQEEAEEEREQERSKLDDDNVVDVGDGNEILVDAEPNMDNVKMIALDNPVIRTNRITGEDTRADEEDIKELSRAVVENHVHPNADISASAYYPKVENYDIESITESEDGRTITTVATGTLYFPDDETDDSMYPSFAPYEVSVELIHFGEEDFNETHGVSITVEGEKFEIYPLY